MANNRAEEGGAGHRFRSDRLLNARGSCGHGGPGMRAAGVPSGRASQGGGDEVKSW